MKRIVLSIFIISVLLLAACTVQTTTTPTTTAIYLFPLFPYGPGESPLIACPKTQDYKDCNLCHIDTSNSLSSIKVLDSHACDACHENEDDVAPCQETIPVNLTCIFPLCHNYP